MCIRDSIWARIYEDFVLISCNVHLISWKVNHQAGIFKANSKTPKPTRSILGLYSRGISLFVIRFFILFNLFWNDWSKKWIAKRAVSRVIRNNKFNKKPFATYYLIFFNSIWNSIHLDAARSTLPKRAKQFCAVSSAAWEAKRCQKQPLREVL